MELHRRPGPSAPRAPASPACRRRRSAPCPSGQSATAPERREGGPDDEEAPREAHGAGGDPARPHRVPQHARPRIRSTKGITKTMASASASGIRSMADTKAKVESDEAGRPQRRRARRAGQSRPAPRARRAASRAPARRSAPPSPRPPARSAAASLEATSISGAVAQKPSMRARPGRMRSVTGRARETAPAPGAPRSSRVPARSRHAARDAPARRRGQPQRRAPRTARQRRCSGARTNRRADGATGASCARFGSSNSRAARPARSATARRSRRPDARQSCGLAASRPPAMQARPTSPETPPPQPPSAQRPRSPAPSTILRLALALIVRPFRCPARPGRSRGGARGRSTRHTPRVKPGRPVRSGAPRRERLGPGTATPPTTGSLGRGLNQGPSPRKEPHARAARRVHRGVGDRDARPWIERRARPMAIGANRRVPSVGSPPMTNGNPARQDDLEPRAPRPPRSLPGL